MPLLRFHARHALCLLVLLCGLPRGARADPLSPWPGEQTTPGSLQLVPLLYVSADASTYSPLFYVSTGFGERWDAFVGVWSTFGPEYSGVDLVDVFPRYHLTPLTALVLRMQLAPGDSLSVGPEVHSTLEWGDFSLMINTGIRPEFELSSGVLRSTTLVASVSPEYHFTDQFSVYCEVNPALSTALPFEGAPSVGAELSFIPGVSFALDPDETHQFSAGVEFTLRRGEGFDPGRSITFGAWYATSFDLGGSAPEGGEGGEGTASSGSRVPRRFAQRAR